MSKVEVDKVIPQSGTTLTIGDSGDTINLVGTLQSNGSPLPGDISSVVAGTGLSGGGTTGAVTLNIEAAQPTITSLGTITGFTSTGIDDNADATAITINSSEQVGIGTTSPSQLLHLKSTTNEKPNLLIETENAGANGGRLDFLHKSSSPADGDLLGDITFGGYSDSGTPPSDFARYVMIKAFAEDVSNNAEKGRLTFSIHSGASNENNLDVLTLNGTNVGIGTTTPDTTLSLEQNNAPILQYKDTSGGTDAKVWRTMGLDSDYRLQTRSDDLATGELAYVATRTGKAIQTHQFFTTDSERLRITSAGLVGIGTTAPEVPLSVLGSDTQIHFNESSASGGGYLMSESAGQFRISGGAGFKVGGSGWIAKSTEAAIIGHDSGGDIKFFSNTSLTAGNTFTPTERMRLNSSGNLGIGTTIPSATSNASYKQFFVSTGGALADSGGSGPATMLLNNSYIGSGNNNYATVTQKAARILMTSGRIDFATAGSVSADAQQTFNERMRINDNGVVSVPSGLALGVGTATTSSNVLDDYEEGDWTPQIKISGSTTGIAYSTQVGKYTKIGNRVIANCEIQLSAKGSNTGNVALIGLPFSTDNDAHQTAYAYNDRVSSQHGDVQVYLNKNTTTGAFYQSRTDGTNNSNITGNEMNATSYLIIGFTYRVA